MDDYLADRRIDENIVWAPQPGPQEALVHCPITLIGYGGARGGGKTDGVLGTLKALTICLLLNSGK